MCAWERSWEETSNASWTIMTAASQSPRQLSRKQPSRPAVLSVLGEGAGFDPSSLVFAVNLICDNVDRYVLSDMQMNGSFTAELSIVAGFISPVSPGPRRQHLPLPARSYCPAFPHSFHFRPHYCGFRCTKRASKPQQREMGGFLLFHRFLGGQRSALRITMGSEKPFV